MATLTWRDVAAPNFAPAMEGWRLASETMNNAFTAGRQGIADWRNNQIREASNSLMSDLMTRYAGNPDRLNADAQSGELLRGYDPRMLSSEAIASIGARQQDLQNFQLGTHNVRLGSARATQAEQDATHQLGVYGDYRQDRTRQNRDVAAADALRPLQTRALQIQAQGGNVREFLALPENRALLEAAPREAMLPLFRDWLDVSQLGANVDQTVANTGLAREQALTEPFRRDQLGAQTEGVRQENLERKTAWDELPATAEAFGEAITENMTLDDMRLGLRAARERLNPRQYQALLQTLNRTHPGLFQMQDYGQAQPAAPTERVPSQTPGTGAPADQAPYAPGQAPPSQSFEVTPEGVRVNGQTLTRQPSNNNFWWTQPGGQAPAAQPLGGGSPDPAALIRAAVESGDSFQPQQPNFRPAAATFGFDEPAAQLIRAAAPRGDPSRVINYEARGKTGITHVPESVDTLGEASSFARQLNRAGARSSAMGTYQIVGDTLRRYAPRVFGRNWQNAEFNHANQDRLGEAIFNDHRHSAEALRKQWVSLSPAEAERVRRMPWAQARSHIARGESGSGGARLASSGGPARGDFGVSAADLGFAPQSAGRSSGPNPLDTPVFNPARAVEATRQEINSFAPARLTELFQPQYVEPIVVDRPSTNVGALMAQAVATARRNT